MEITININGNSEYELYNEFMDKLLKLRKSNKTAKTTEKRFFLSAVLGNNLKLFRPSALKLRNRYFLQNIKI